MKRLLVLLFLLPTLTYAQGAGTPPYRGVNNWPLIFGTDNLYDIGANGAQRPRTGYFGTSLFTPALTVSGLTATRCTFAGTGGLLSDDADCTFSGSRLTVTDLTVGTSLLASSGSTAGGGLAFSANPTTTWFNVGGTMNLAIIGTHTARFDATGFTSQTALRIGNPVTGPDVILSRDAATVLQLGFDVNGAAVAQTIKAHDGITGTNVLGANLTLAGGRGTGSAAAGNVRFQTAPAVASGTTAQVLEDRGLIVGRQFTLTDNTIATFSTFTLGNDTGGGGTIHYCVYAADATTSALECGDVDYAGVDVTAGAGGETCPTPTKQGTPLQALSGATLAVTFAASTGTDLCNIRVTADPNIATPVELWIKWAADNSGRTLNPQ